MRKFKFYFILFVCAFIVYIAYNIAGMLFVRYHSYIMSFIVFCIGSAVMDYRALYQHKNADLIFEDEKKNEKKEIEDEDVGGFIDLA